MSVKRAVPVTTEERKARNRRYQHARRHKTGNGYARAYRRAMQKAVWWVQANKPALWRQWLEEEQLAVERAQARGKGKPYTPVTKGDCKHDGEHFVMGVAVGCSKCGQALGVEDLTDDDRAKVNDIMEARDR